MKTKRPEVERLEKYHRRWEQSFDRGWSKFSFKTMKDKKVRYFRKSRYFEFKFLRTDGKEYTVTNVDLHNMNPSDILHMGIHLGHRSESSVTDKYHYLSMKDYLYFLLHEFGMLDVEVLEHHPDDPTLAEPNFDLENIEDYELGIHTEPELGVIFCLMEDNVRMSERNLWKNEYIKGIIELMLNDEGENHENKQDIIDQLQWLLQARKFFKKVVKYHVGKADLSNSANGHLGGDCWNPLSTSEVPLQSC